MGLWVQLMLAARILWLRCCCVEALVVIPPVPSHSETVCPLKAVECCGLLAPQDSGQQGCRLAHLEVPNCTCKLAEMLGRAAQALGALGLRAGKAVLEPAAQQTRRMGKTGNAICEPVHGTSACHVFL